MIGPELLWEGAICGDGGICGKVHLEAFSLERKEVMGILFKRGLQRPLEGDNGLPFSSWWDKRLVGVFICQCSWS